MPRTGDSDRNEQHGLTHIDGYGHARMVDVTAKALTYRVAQARCLVATKLDIIEILRTDARYIELLEMARFAGMQGAKQTASLIPLCHPIGLDDIHVDLNVQSHSIVVSTTVTIFERTGVEMEALTACAISALTLTAALFELDHEISVGELTLWHKSGGRSGDWHRNSAAGVLAPRVSDATGT